MLEQPSLSEFQKKLAERKAIEEAEAAAKQTPKVVPTGDTFDPDLIPEPAYDRSEDDLKIDSIIDGIDILDAYARW